MSLAPGARIGVYEVTAQIGAGGMGEVYRARDSRLQRDVALKILPAAFASDAERLARFEREAQVLASLNHSNIAAIYGFEDGRALVMELVEGPTLADRIAQGALLLDEALPIARQIVDALEAAHEHGIVHRDLKPANIKLRPDGTVKVLDFGLAKLAPGAHAPSGSGASMSPTLSLAFTGAGIILGTAAYMAPEQARGKAVDKRADIWAFGCVLFEMLTGARTFDGTDATEMIAAVVRAEPDWAALPPSTPPRMRALLKRCLEKDPKQRLRDIGDARLELAQATEPLAEPPRTVAAVQTPVWRRLLAFAAVAAAAAATAGAAVWMLRPEPVRQVMRFVVPLPEDQTYFYTGRHVLAVSPTNTHVAYVANGQIFLRAFDQVDAVPVRGTAGTTAGNGARSPFFSPDGQWLGFWQDGQLKKVSVNGGAPVVLCAAQNPFGVSWSDDNTILFGQGAAGISRVSGDGGTPEVVIKVEKGEGAHGPQLLPDGRTVLFTLSAGSANWDQAKMVAQSLDTGARKVLFEGGTDARYVDTGHLVYVTQGSLLALPFDIPSLQVTGGPVPLVDEVAQADGGATGAAHFSVSRDGTLVYTSEGEGTFFRRTLVWVDRNGREEPITVPPRAYTYVRLSPDGTKIALDIREDANDIWTWDLTRGSMTRLTRNAGLDRGPAWTSDSKRVAFSTAMGSEEAAYIQPADGSSAPQQLSMGRNVYFPSGFSPDDKYLLAHHAPSGPFDIVLIDIDNKGQVQPLLAEPYSELNGTVSPDGRWLAYQSDESGTHEIYVRPFPNVGESRVSISTGGGTRPVWSRNGRTLFYYMDPGVVMAVPIELQSTLSAGTPTVVVKGEYMAPQSGRAYDVSPDGQRFLMIKEGDAENKASRQQFIVVQNWFEELKRRVPTR